VWQAWKVWAVWPGKQRHGVEAQCGKEYGGFRVAIFFL
jgi:hypothetical protein